MTETIPARAVPPISEPKTAATPRRRKFGMLTPLLLELGVPLAVYYLLHSFGVSDVVALTVGAAVPGARLLIGVVHNRRLDRFGAFVCAMFALGAALLFVTGDARLVLAKQAAFVFVAGVACLLSLLRRPAVLGIARPMATHGEARLEALWDNAWTTTPVFRRALRASTAAFGVALILDAVGRVVVAYTVPMSAAVTLANAPGLVAIVAALVFHLRHTKPVFERIVADAE